jgi:hypothetical protein
MVMMMGWWKRSKPSMVEQKCENKRCGKMFQARKADVDRGWGRFCCKSCKAVVQEKRTGQYRNFIFRETVRAANDGKSPADFQREYGGIPVFDRHGRYEGFLDGAFDNTQHQDQGPDDPKAF